MKPDAVSPLQATLREKETAHTLALTAAIADVVADLKSVEATNLERMERTQTANNELAMATLTETHRRVQQENQIGWQSQIDRMATDCATRLAGMLMSNRDNISKSDAFSELTTQSSKNSTSSSSHAEYVHISHSNAGEYAYASLWHGR